MIFLGVRLFFPGLYVYIERDREREIQVGVHTQIPMYEQQQSRCIEAMAAAQKNDRTNVDLH